MPEPATAFPHSRRADDAKSDPQRETENMIRANHQMLERLMENSENRKA
jgi:hypothetical protein